MFPLLTLLEVALFGSREATVAYSLGRKPLSLPTNLVSREAAKARSTRRKPWVTECTRELSREAAAAFQDLLSPLRGFGNRWLEFLGLTHKAIMLSPLSGWKSVTSKLTLRVTFARRFGQHCRKPFSPTGLRR